MASGSREGHDSVIFKGLATRKFTHVPMSVWATHSKLSCFFSSSSLLGVGCKGRRGGSGRNGK